MISCRDVATIIMSDQFEALPWLRRMEIRLHLAMCKLCARLASDIKQLRRKVRSVADMPVNPDFEAELVRRLSNL